MQPATSVRCVLESTSLPTQCIAADRKTLSDIFDDGPFNKCLTFYCVGLIAFFKCINPPFRKVQVVLSKVEKARDELGGHDSYK